MCLENEKGKASENQKEVGRGQPRAFSALILDFKICLKKQLSNRRYC